MQIFVKIKELWEKITKKNLLKKLKKEGINPTIRKK